MELIIDQGNTSVKIALYNDSSLISFDRINNPGLEEIERLCNQHAIERAIISSVKKDNAGIVQILENRSIQFIELTDQTPLPISIAYKTPHTLGRDRIAAVIGAWELNPGQPSLVIDAGTAVTYDFINEKGCYIGGNISVGLELRNKTLSSYTDNLPYISLDGDTPDLGYSTETALRSGITYGLAFEIERYIEFIKAKHTAVSIFLTGGDAKRLANKLKYAIFAYPNLVMIGLKRILDYNVKK